MSRTAGRGGRALVALALVALVVLAGCSDYTFVGVEPSVEATANGDGTYRAMVTVAADSQEGLEYENLRVVGLDVNGESVCVARFGTVAADAGVLTETVTCSTVPLAFVPRSAESRLTGTPVLDGETVVHDRATVTQAGGDRVRYRPDEIVIRPEEAIDRGVCAFRRAGVQPGDIAGPAPWLNVTRLDPVVRGAYEITVENRSDDDNGVDTGQGLNAGLETKPLPDDPALDPVRAAVRGERDGGGDVQLAADATINRSQAVAIHDALLNRSIDGLDDVPAIPEDSPPRHVEAVPLENPRIDCDAGAAGEYVGSVGVDATYAVGVNGSRWTVALTAREDWSGPAFGPPGAERATDTPTGTAPPRTQPSPETGTAAATPSTTPTPTRTTTAGG